MNKEQLNQKKVYQSIELLTAQIEQGWQLTAEVKLPQHYKGFDNIVVCGMGGSNIGYHLVRSVLGNQLKLPVIINAEYNLPAFVNKKSLIILSSYSGDTEEVVNCAQQVVKRRLKGLIVTTGGKLAKLVDKKIPGIVLPTDFNPSNEPRWGLGYSIGAFLNLLSRLTSVFKESQLLIANKSVSDSKLIQGLAKKLAGKQVLIVAAEHLQGNAHILTNQLNESADNLAFWLSLPELDHHFLEALSFPKDLAQKKIAVLFLTSFNYSPVIAKRVKITAQVFKKQGLQVEFLEVNTDFELQDSLSTLQLGSYLCYHISVVNKVDPIAIPWVYFFKREMKK